MNNRNAENERIQQNYQNAIKNVSKKSFVFTPYIATIGGTDLLPALVLGLIEMGVTMVRFKMAYVTKNNKIEMLQTINKCIEIYKVTNKGYMIPLTICVDIPNACIKTGALRDDINELEILIKENSIVQITSHPKSWNKCDHKSIYIDDPYIIKSVSPGTEISIHFGEIVMICTEVMNAQTLNCKVIKGGKLKNMDFVCTRGVTHIKPPLSKLDLDLIEFAKEFKVDVVIINSVRQAETLRKVRAIFTGDEPPLIMSTICEQEGLDNIDEIIKLSDGIILAREFLACEIVDKHKMVSIQLSVGSKCRQKRKPFFISGNILEKSMQLDKLAACDSVDITNAILQGAGFLLRSFSSIQDVTQAVKYINCVAKTVEAVHTGSFDLWRMIDQIPCPVIAPRASAIGCALMAKQMAAAAIIVITVTGHSTIDVAQFAPEIPILAVTKNPAVARKLHAYRAVIPLVYDCQKVGGWTAEMEERIEFAINYAIDFNIMKYGNNCVVLKKSTQDSIFADNVSTFVVTTDRIRRTQILTHDAQKECTVKKQHCKS